MALAESDILARYRHWCIFGTGTFSGTSLPSRDSQAKLVCAFLYKSAKILRVPFGGLAWVTRHELGELGGRAHYHWLLGSSEITSVSVTDCFRLNDAWDKLPRCGYSRNHVFNPALNGIDYICECLGSTPEHLTGSVGGDYYESRKFSAFGSTLTLSNSLLRMVGGSRKKFGFVSLRA